MFSYIKTNTAEFCGLPLSESTLIRSARWQLTSSLVGFKAFSVTPPSRRTFESAGKLCLFVIESQSSQKLLRFHGDKYGLKITVLTQCTLHSSHLASTSCWKLSTTTFMHIFWYVLRWFHLFWIRPLKLRTTKIWQQEGVRGFIRYSSVKVRHSDCCYYAGLKTQSLKLWLCSKM